VVVLIVFSASAGDVTEIVLSVRGNGPFAGDPAAATEACPIFVLLAPTAPATEPTDIIGTANTPIVACPTAATPIVTAALACPLAVLPVSTLPPAEAADSKLVLKMKVNAAIGNENFTRVSQRLFVSGSFVTHWQYEFQLLSQLFEIRYRTRLFFFNYLNNFSVCKKLISYQAHSIVSLNQKNPVQLF